MIIFYDTMWTNTGIQWHAKANDNHMVHNVIVPCGPLGPVIEHVFGGKLNLTPRLLNFFSVVCGRRTSKVQKN